MSELQALFAEGFREPPRASRPLAWWHWMNGNISKDGIIKDLEWMARIGLGGVQNFDAALATPLIVDHRLGYMTSDWQDAFRLAVSKASSLGLEYGIAGSPGWSESGGPWVKPEDGMKKVVWTETTVEGGADIDVVLPQPPRCKGPFQDSLFVPHVCASAPAIQIDDYYADACVLAYPATEPSFLQPACVKDSGSLVSDPSALFDGSYSTALHITRGTANQPGYLDLIFDRPVTARSLRVAVEANGRIYRKGDIAVEVQVSSDELNWRSVAHLEIMNGVPTTASFPAIESKHFRIVFHPSEPENPRAEYSRAPGAIVPEVLPTSQPMIPVREISLMAEARVDRSEMKSGFAIAADYYDLESEFPEHNPVNRSDVIDLSGHMDSDGRLRWQLPAGMWRILRLGYSLTGTLNHPATSEATGLEVDKYDAAAVRRYINQYLANFRDVLGGNLVGENGLRSIIVDSIETGLANWTPRLVEKFIGLRGYDPTPWLPALTGVIVESRAETDQFLYDFRRTLADLLATEHYGTIAEVARGNGLVVYGEATEVSRPVLGDDMSMRRYTDVPMSAMWTFHPHASPRPTLIADIKGAASVAHVYGQNLAAAESLTAAYSPWAFSPWDLKLAIDLEFAMGINRPVIHSSVHQPSDDAVPGLSLSIFGQYFNRHDTWADLAKPWIDYIARCSYLLRVGRCHADVAYFYGEEAPLTAVFEKEFAPGAPKTTDFDFINSEALLEVLRVQDGNLVTPSGCSYRVLFLGGTSHRMTLGILRHIEELVHAGATIVGRAPRSSPSLRDDASAFAEIVAKLWRGDRVTRFGLGVVVDDTDVDAVLREIGVVADLVDQSGNPISELMFIHRVEASGHIYFLSNRRDEDRDFSIALGAVGTIVQAWDASTGTVYDLPAVHKGEATLIDLSIPARGSIFVVISNGEAGRANPGIATSVTRSLDLGNDWLVSFEEGRGAPNEVRLSLGSLTDNSDPGIRFFSGVATYTKDFDITLTDTEDEIWLDLGSVGDLAEVYVNGTYAGAAWKAPWSVEISSHIREGANSLSVKVANVWVNRLIGDAQPGAKRVAFTTAPTYLPDAPLRPSGLIGPVHLRMLHRSS